MFERELRDLVAAEHPESAASEVIEDAGFVVRPEVKTLTETLDRALQGERPSRDPTDRATKYDWDNVASQAKSAYRRAVSGQW